MGFVTAGIDVALARCERELAEHLGAWEDLAVATGRPYCAPAWMLAWWRHRAAGEGARLRVVIMHQGSELVGVAPFFLAPRPLAVREYRLLAGVSSWRVEPRARPVHEWAVADAIAAALRSALPRPDVVRLDRIDARSPWPTLIAEGWSGRRRPAVRLGPPVPGPVVTLGGRTYDEWFATKTQSFRREARRRQHKLDAAGATIRISAVEDLERDLDAFARLHEGRWKPRGGSNALRPGTREMLLDAARHLAPKGRLRLYLLEVAAQPIAAQLCLAAGGEVSCYLSGMDDRWGAHSPGGALLLAALEDSFRRREQRFDLGAGGQSYKLRVADTDEALVSGAIYPPGPRYAMTRMHERTLQIGRAGLMLSRSARARAARQAP